MTRDRRRIRVLLVGVAVAVSGGACSSKSAPASVSGSSTGDTFPTQIFPSPVAPVSGGSAALPPGASTHCPNPAGIATGQLTTATALSVINGIVQAGRLGDAEEHVDPAAWPWVTDLQQSGTVPLKAALNGGDVSVSPAAGSPYEQTLDSLCGAPLIQQSWVVAWCLSATAAVALPYATCLAQDPAETHYSYLLLRHGRWLVWQDQSG